MSKLLFVLGGGIGNIVQAMPAVKAAASEDYKIDLLLCCNSSNDLDIFRTNYVENVYSLGAAPQGKYDFQLEGNLFLKKGQSVPRLAKRIKSRVKFSRHVPEAEYYYDIVKQIGISTPMEDVRINHGSNGPRPKHPDTVALYPGSKPNWSMKRWDKYDELAKHFPHVTLIGTKQDIHSTGNPTWIKKAWEWPKHVNIFTGSLQEVAHYISCCKFFVGNDGGISHVAAGTGVPVYVLFGPSSVEKNKPYSKQAKAIAIDLGCRPCQYKKGKQYLLPGKANCPYKMKCLRDMSVEFVLGRIPSLRSGIPSNYQIPVF